jgi:hypothetical protein
MRCVCGVLHRTLMLCRDGPSTPETTNAKNMALRLGLGCTEKTGPHL